MWKKGFMLGFALLLLVAANMHLSCRVSVNGVELPGKYSLQTVERAVTTASRAAEEIMPGLIEMPEIRRTYSLQLCPAEGDEPALAEAALRAVSGVKIADVAYVNGTRLGIVEDGSELAERLNGFITGQQPNAAVSGSISGRLEIHRLYSRAGQAVNYDDMLLLITGMAPVIYVDENGKLV